MSADGRERQTIVLLHTGFVLAGMATTLLGPVLPVLVARWRLGDAGAGALFTAQFLSSMMATVASTVIVARIGPGRTLAAGFLLIGAGAGALGVSPLALGVVATIVYGCGLGFVLPVTNFVVAALRPERASSALSLVNVSWGVGAVTWPLVVRAVAGPTSVAGATTALALGSLAMGAGLWGLAPERRGLRKQAAAAVAGRTNETSPAPYRRAGLVGAAIFLYVGVETAVGGWAAEFARRMAHASADPSGTIWGFAPTAFWALQTIGRLLAPAALLVVSEQLVLLASLGLAGLAIAGLAFVTTSAGGAVAGAAVAGLGLAAIFPVMLAGATRDIAPRLPAAMGPLFAAGGVGGAVLPWVVGLVSSAFGSLQAGLLVPLAALAAIFAIVIGLGPVRSHARR